MIHSEAIINNFKSDFQIRFSTSTINNYARSVNQLLEHTEKPVKEITKRDIKNWLCHLTEKGYKAATVYLHVCGLKSFFNYCIEEELITEDPTKHISFPRREEKVPKYLTKEQLAKLREHVGKRVRERAIIEVLYTTGVRISELAAMKKSDINWMERTILIPEGKGKKGRIVLFTPECAAYLQAYLNKRKDHLPYVFLNMLETRPLRKNNEFQTFTNELGFRVTHHILRHTFAAHLAQKGMPLEYIKTLLGHNDIKNTKIYTRLYNAARKEMYDEWM